MSPRRARSELERLQRRSRPPSTSSPSVASWRTRTSRLTRLSSTTSAIPPASPPAADPGAQRAAASPARPRRGAAACGSPRRRCEPDAAGHLERSRACGEPHRPDGRAAGLERVRRPHERLRVAAPRRRPRSASSCARAVGEVGLDELARRRRCRPSTDARTSSSTASSRIGSSARSRGASLSAVVACLPSRRRARWRRRQLGRRIGLLM